MGRKVLVCWLVMAALLVLGGENPARVKPLAQEYVVVCRSPEPTNVFCYTPGICRLESGRLVATCDWGGRGSAKYGLKGKVFVSDDHGESWRKTGEFPFCHARPFVAGNSVYVLGHRSTLGIVRSDDLGESWSLAADLSTSSGWHQSACNVWYAKGNVYLVMERRVSRKIKHWQVGELAPVLMRAKVGDDLTRAGSWMFADEVSFQDALPGALEETAPTDYFGIPFYKPMLQMRSKVDGRKRVKAAPIGWLETNVVQFMDPNHIWFDPEGNTFYLWARAHTAGTGYAAIAKVTELADGSMKTSLAEAPSGKRMLFVPCPGGQMRFHVIYDDVSRLYWLLSTQATDSMCRYETMSKRRFDLPNNERHRLQLSFSKNMIDWCFAGLVCKTDDPGQARHYASMCIDGDDLCILSRSGDEKAQSAHNGNMITFHRVKDFRSLIY